jgi:hypothetical protein
MIKKFFMKIPKYILHPFILLCGGALILALVWQRTPLPGDMKKAVENIPVRHTPLPARKDLLQITDLSNEGRFITPTPERSFQINDSRFQHLTEEQRIRLKSFLRDKLFMPPANSGQAMLDLPIALYEEVCFTQPLPDSQMQSCPVYLNP